MEQKKDRTSMPEQQNREHGRSDRGGPGHEQPPREEQFPGQHGRTDPGRMKGGDTAREAGRHESGQGREQPDAPRKFGERRPEPAPTGQKRESR
jgi:hypothetical protein